MAEPIVPDMSPVDVARMLSVRPETVKGWLRAGEFPNSYLLPGRAGYRIPRVDVDAFRERRRHAAPVTPRRRQKSDE